MITYLSAKYTTNIRTVDYAGSDGSHLLRTGGTIAWRFNNPGNIRPSNKGLIMGAIGIGETAGNGSFLIFACYEDGRRQKRSLLRRVYNDRTIYTMLTGVPDKHGVLQMGYAPTTDHNDPADYANSISKHTGFPTTTVLSTLSDDQLDKVLDAMEKKEGFHGLKETRVEKVIQTTTVTVSDGARPRPDLPVQVKIGDKTHQQTTDKNGQLPKIAHTKMGEKVEVHVPTLGGLWEKLLEFNMGTKSDAYVLFHDLNSYSAPTALKKSPVTPTGSATVRKPLRHVVDAKETLGTIAAAFKTTVAELMQNNPQIKDASKIYVGQVIGIYGVAPPHPSRRAVRSSSATNAGSASANTGTPAAPAASAAPAAAPSAPAARATPAAPARAAELSRSNEGAGQPLAIVTPDHRRAPWMLEAIREAQLWDGKKERVITSTQNFHHELGLVGEMTHTPWCASFVNYCLKSSDTPYERSASSQFAVSSRKFKKIEKPIYGAIMVMRNYVKATGRDTGKGHVTFVYGKTHDGRIACLGGNQGDAIKFSKYKPTGVSSEFSDDSGVRMQQKFYGFYIPVTYDEFARSEGELGNVNLY